MAQTDGDLRRTPLYEAHKALGARMMPFAGWEMPVQYTSIIAEHRAVRSRAGLFDVSHLGRIRIEGPQAEPLLQRVLTVDVSRMAPGKARYSMLCREDGGILDDPVLYRLEADRFILVCNAISTRKVLDWLGTWNKSYGATLTDVTQETGALAFQGPRAAGHLAVLCTSTLNEMPPFTCVPARVAGLQGLVARTGYTGEDGFEIYLHVPGPLALWQVLMQHGMVPCGLGARDTLRLEAGFLLYGQDMDETVNPFEAGLERFVHLEKREFVGREALLVARDRPPERRMVGLVLVGPGVARSGYPILHQGWPVGRVTSGTYAPTLDVSIALGYVPPAVSSPGTRLEIDIRGRTAEAEVVSRPFYRREKFLPP
ncbi:MAG: glycine cleavage system aminomethyltransferase GcvT [Chloroflexi bacterium]|nr:glycine cleavage system aminomethyltransferase GcvT [Chloroflexota bacterium]